MEWYLYASPPYADIIMDNGDKHRTEVGGRNYVQPAGFEGCHPIMGCLFPRVALTLYLFNYLKKWGGALLLCLVGINVIYGMMVYWAPQGAEVFQSSMLRIGHIVNLTLMAFICTAAFFVFVRLGTRTITFSADNLIPDRKPKVKPLEPTSWTPYSIEPDVLVYSKFGEEPKDFAARLEQAIQVATPAKWVVCIEYRSPMVVIYTGSNDYITSGRAIPSFEGDDWPSKDRVCQHETPFTAESYQQYMEYWDRFVPLYLEWVPMRKLSLDPDRAGRTYLEIVQENARVAANVLIAMLICVVSVFGQKSEELRTYMGPTADQTCPAGSVVIAFEKGRFPRTSDGSKTWVQVLEDVYLYDDNKGAGNVKAVEHTDKAGVKTVYKKYQPVAATVQPQQPPAAPQPQTQPQAPTTMTPVTNTTPIMGAPLNLDADSTEIADGFKQAEESVLKIRSKLWNWAAPGWVFLMWVFGLLEPLIIMGMSLTWYYASTAAGESAINMYGIPVFGRWIYRFHQGNAAALLVFTWIITTVTLINIFLWLMRLGWSLWLMLVVWIPVLLLARWLTNKLVPNPNVMTDSFDAQAQGQSPYRRLRAG